jgi:hypothetical protein
MLNVYSNKNSVLYELRDLYIKELNKNGQDKIKNIICFYDLYSDGTPIKSDERKILKNRLDMQNIFSKTNPYDKYGNSYYLWFQNEVKTNDKIFQTKEELFYELNNIYSSRSWKLTKLIRKFWSIIKIYK